MRLFLAPSPRGGRHSSRRSARKRCRHFNPRPPRGGRLSIHFRRDETLVFQSTPPARGATQPPASSPACPGISIHAPREGGDQERRGHCQRGRISIHAPREGGDDYFAAGSLPYNISIHAPREGGDTPEDFCSRAVREFQSTPPARGATAALTALHPDSDISIHAPREGGDRSGGDPDHIAEISIHAPREGGDSKDAQFYL